MNSLRSMLQPVFDGFSQTEKARVGVNLLTNPREKCGISVFCLKVSRQTNRISWGTYIIIQWMSTWFFNASGNDWKTKLIYSRLGLCQNSKNLKIPLLLNDDDSLILGRQISRFLNAPCQMLIFSQKSYGRNIHSLASNSTINYRHTFWLACQIWFERTLHPYYNILCCN